MTDWIEWNGGECPVDEGDEVEVKLRGAPAKSARPAGDFFWGRYDDPEFAIYDIIRYRVTQRVPRP